MLGRRAQESARSAKRCWNCQDRKIACDKTLPGCLKCQQRGKPCGGYGLRLSWPRDDDPRRLSARGDHFFLQATNKDCVFVHASTHDMRLLRGEPVYFDRLSSFSHVPASLAAVDPTLHNGRSGVPALLAAAADDFDNVYGLLVRMALTDNGPSALATRHALAALAFQSFGSQQRAYRHLALANRALQTAIESRMQPSQSFQAMAASMLLNYYESRDARGSPLSSAIYFCGCKRIALSVHREHTDYEGDLATLLDWILYHDAMYKFSIHHWAQRLPQQQMVGDGPKIVSKPIFSPLRHVVNTTFGCSLELLDLICQIVDLVPGEAGLGEPPETTTAMSTTASASTDAGTESQERARQRLALRLENIHQHVSAVSAAEPARDTAADRKKSRLEAEARLYHIAAHLYLERLGRGVDKDNGAVQALLDEAFALLAKLQHCRRPWVLFVVGVEARDEAERRLVMAIMLGQPGLPTNLALVKRLIQAAWTQIDLLSLSTPAKSMGMVQVYNTVISANEFPPSFA